MGNMAQAGSGITMNQAERMALDRLVGFAGGRSECSQAVADLLLAWWNADACGRMDPRALWECEDWILDDVVTAFGVMTRCRSHPSQHPYATHFARLATLWRPEL